VTTKEVEQGGSGARAAPGGRERQQGRVRRLAPRSHPYAHYIRALPRALADLASDLDVRPGGRVLDYGCADAPYRRFFAADVEFVGADLPGNPDASLELNGDGTVPVADESFDAVLSTQVLEHVDDPALYLRECLRVLRPGGHLLLSTHGTFIYHPDPEDYWRWTCAGLKKAVADAGFAVVRFEGVVGLGATGLQLVEHAIYGRLRGERPRRICGVAFHALMRVADWFEDDSARRLNACVFALVARKP